MRTPPISSRAYESAHVLELCRHAALNHGASAEMADALATAAVHAESRNKPSVGVTHFFDYLDALREGRIQGAAQPTVDCPTPPIILADAHGGAPHVAFDKVFDDLVKAAQVFGVSVFSQRNAYTCGALGYFVERMASQGLVSIAGANSPALMSTGGSSSAVFGTNPLAFAAPQDGKPPLVIDQASSQTAFVNIREAARTQKPIPPEWALDRAGSPTTDPRAALQGSLLPFGGFKGANIALIIEILSVMSGASWSVDAWPFDSGDRSPSVGMFVVSIDPVRFDADFSTRLTRHLDRLRLDYGVHIPGDARLSSAETSAAQFVLPVEVFNKLQAMSRFT